MSTTSNSLKLLPRFLFPSSSINQNLLDFNIHNLPFGVFSTKNKSKRIGVKIGDKILDCKQLAHHKLLHSTLLDEDLNGFMSQESSIWRSTREQLQRLLSDDDQLSLGKSERLLQDVIVEEEEATMHLPARIGDYTDFYSSKQHAVNISEIMRGKGSGLMPQWTHLPIGYHGRSSSIVVDGGGIHRPNGQLLETGETSPIFTACRALDFELEMGMFVGGSNNMGEPTKLGDAENRIFGMVLMNDWSARDIQRWEYFPLGPFLSKSFATTISPWLVTLDALKPFKCKSIEQDPQPLPYLRHKPNALSTYDINLEVYLSTASSSPNKYLISKVNFNSVYWTMAQQLTHHTSGGCPMKAGDMFASGTISEEDMDRRGSLIELTMGGTQQIELPNGERRSYLMDGDTVEFRGYCEKDGIRIGFGKCEATVLPAISY